MSLTSMSKLIASTDMAAQLEPEASFGEPV